MREAYVDQLVAALYASTDSAGTYIGQLLVSLKAFLFAKVGGVVARQVMFVRFEQLWNTKVLILVTPLPIIILVSPVQFLKTL